LDEQKDASTPDGRLGHFEILPKAEMTGLAEEQTANIMKAAFPFQLLQGQVD
jgi:hypothetical protein